MRKKEHNELSFLDDKDIPKENEMIKLINNCQGIFKLSDSCEEAFKLESIELSENLSLKMPYLREIKTTKRKTLKRR